MTPSDLLLLTKDIVADAQKLSILHTGETNAPVNYACIFCQSELEYNEKSELALQVGAIAEDTPTGIVFLIPPLDTLAGPLRLLKIRKPDPKRLERGDADFTIAHFTEFKEKFLSKTGFSHIQRPNTEMLELSDPGFNVLAYYSFPTLPDLLIINS